jgi:hypothetical protein
VDRGHRRQGREPRSLDRGGPRRRRFAKSIAAESGERGSRERAGANASARD